MTSKINSIKEAIKTFGFERKIWFTYSELSKIAIQANVEILDVMTYLRTRKSGR